MGYKGRAAEGRGRFLAALGISKWADKTEPTAPGRFESWYREATEEQHNEGNLFPPAMEDSDALEILFHYLLPDDWYCVDPLGPKQVNAIAVRDILEKHSELYRNEMGKRRNR